MISYVKKILFISTFFLLSTTWVDAAQYRVIATDAARSFWDTGNGYCGSWSVQNVGITMGFWMGQNQGRKLIGNKEVLLGVNMDKLLDALNLTYIENYHEKDNQIFLEWATASLKNKEPVIIGVKCHDSWCQDEDYDHIIPLHAVDISQSTYNADDVVYFSDGLEPSEFNMLFSRWAYGADDPNQYWYLPIHNRKTNWGVKVTGMKGDDETIPISLTIHQDREPNIAEGESGTTMTGSVNMTGLLPGTTYTLLRWDVDYTRYQNVPVSNIGTVAAADDIELTFTAADTTYTKDVSFYSDGITIFKLIKGTLDDEVPDELPDDLPDDLPELPVKAQHIQQVFLNLLNNARRSLNLRYPGKDTNKRIEIKSEITNKDGRKWLRISFTDNGVGIESKNIDDVFDPEFTTKNGDCLGLDLGISRDVMLEHNGVISLESEPGEYTTVNIDLPFS